MPMGPAPRDLRERFYSHVDKHGPFVPGRRDLGRCWVWTASTSRKGYGKFGVRGGGHEGAHRWAVAIEDGLDKPPLLHVLHHCDNPLCVRRSHLFTGTNEDNIRDMLAKHRENHAGEHNGKARLTEAQVLEIIRRIATTTDSGKVIGLDYGVSHETINAIRRGQAWSHLPRM